MSEVNQAENVNRQAAAPVDEDQVCCMVLVTVLFGIISTFCFSFGYASLTSWKNTGTIGTIVSNSTLSAFDRCWANVSFVADDNAVIQAIVPIPCPTVSDIFGLPIPLCYNRWHPQNVAYDNPALSKYGDSATSPCSSIGYTEAHNDVVVGYISLTLWIGFVYLIFSPQIHATVSHLVSYLKQCRNIHSCNRISMNGQDEV